MAAVLNDPGLRVSTLPMDPDDGEDPLGAGGLDEDDVRALLASLS